MKAKKKISCGVVAALCLNLLGQMPAMQVAAANPLVQTNFSPDPAPVVFGDELWVFTGCDKDARNDNYYMVGWQAFSTTDMQNWTDHGMILKDNEFSWCTENNAWASQCIERNGKYYFYFTTTDPQRGREIGVGVADKPEGPYKDVLGKPLVGPNWDYIDPTVIIDDDGQAWLMFGNPKCYYVKLKEDMVTLDGQINTFNLSLPNGTRYGEGPWIYKHDNLYYLVFASFVEAFGGESISYCTGPSVTGPWTFRGTIHEGSNCFTTHGGIIDYKGHSYSFYHMNGLSGGGSYNRSAACEEFTYGSDGSIPALKSTRTGPQQIEAFNPYQRIEAETMNWSEGIKTEKIDAGTLAIGFIENNDYVKLSGVDFGTDGAKKFFASVASAGQGGTIEVHLDSATGTKVASVEVPVTGDWQEWQTVESDVSGATGSHDVYFVFKGGDSYLFNVDWWQFSKDGSIVVTPGTSSKLGDVNGDDKINGIDLSLAKRVALGKLTDSAAKKAADVDQSGTVDETDLAWYVSYLLHETEEFPEKYTPPTPPKSEYVYNSAVQFREAPSGTFEDTASQKGTVHEEKYNGINGNKTMYVYTPYNYDPSKQYNIFYLMHGGSENETTCFFNKDCHFQYMLDHMIEQGLVDPMIMVTPTFNNCPSADDVNAEMRQSIIPYVEKKYSTYANGDTSLDSLKASRFHRAYGGFSMGGGSTWANFVMNLDIIAYWMPLSGHSWNGTAPIYQAIDNLGMTPRDYFVFAATGSSDQAYGNMNPMINEMKQNSRFVYTSDWSQGNFYYLVGDGRTHWWGNVKHYVYDAIPQFFRENQ